MKEKVITIKLKRFYKGLFWFRNIMLIFYIIFNLDYFVMGKPNKRILYWFGIDLFFILLIDLLVIIFITVLLRIKSMKSMIFKMTFGFFEIFLLFPLLVLLFGFTFGFSRPVNHVLTDPNSGQSIIIQEREGIYVNEYYIFLDDNNIIHKCEYTFESKYNIFNENRIKTEWGEESVIINTEDDIFVINY